jgi:hypothetical protein
VGTKRALSSSDGDGEEKKGESDASAMDEAPTPCPPQGKVSKEEKRREKRRKRKERRKADNRPPVWREEDAVDDDGFELSHHFGYSKYAGMYG